ncbi:phosphocholine-specific phospholipase C [Novosphingobium mangrovi (ex Huang et al. 2023)]|uniref:phospholipase C n=1 Tax=Novosphingobium mangrovi (ex Huang et al. 2023) TaxID=2976432 RepID=A0ABT2I9G0_9SPHN|nr:phospholipase C, phosphocholine-specific [Novosphingobium mangrovi (ex Huang et al. 2023)]MCT2401475.1 phospholipase C, phosphocholine-specific [Novosphingobium mangrovi (ex Huang et al. 2023)]
MVTNNRREFLKAVGALGTAASVPASIDRALALPARRVTGTLQDVKHIVILMQENRSFDHYFGTMKGVRGFGDRHTVPLPEGRSVWEQFNGARVLPPFHLDTEATNAMKIPGTPHSFADAQAAWNQGSFGLWPKFKTDYSMGYFKREDIPFQFALAEAFTICDAYHCSVTSGTDPNRIVFWSGSSFDPQERVRGVNCRDDKSEPNNLRCWIKGALPEPGYTYAGNALEWPSIPEVLEQQGIDWRIYQDPNDNWTGAMHGGLAFKGFRTCKPGEGLYERGMRHWSLERLEQDVRDGTLPAVSWVLPPREWSEHPSASTPIEGAEFTARVLDALTANPDVWGSTVFFQTFDENDGLFDHVPPPAPPSFNKDGTLAGKATFSLDGEYFDDHEDRYTSRDDNVTGTTRPWGLGPRVPMYVVSPWSKGGWVNSETFDHTSVGRFLEKRFGITIPAISPWHRAMCGDLTSCFDFSLEGDRAFPRMPDTRGSKETLQRHLQRPKILPPRAAEHLLQEQGLRRSRALPYVLHVDAETTADTGAITLRFVNEGSAGAVFHVYDRHHLDRLPRRYCTEAGKTLEDTWMSEGEEGFDLLVLGPNGFMRSFAMGSGAGTPKMVVRHDPKGKALLLVVENPGTRSIALTIGRDQYGANEARTINIAAGAWQHLRWPVEKTERWYDFVVDAPGYSTRLAGRIEDGSHGVSDPLLFS